MKLLAIVLGSLALSACGGGDTETETVTVLPTVTAASAEGVYGGALTGSTSSAFQMLILENGDVWSMYGTNTPSAFLVAGFVQGAGTSNNGSFTASGKDFGFAPALAGTVNATYDATAKTISGTTTSTLGATSFSGGPIAGSLYDYAKAASLSTVTGSWSTTALTGEGVAINVAANGTFTAISSLGCNFSGTIAPRASGKNVFNTAFTFGPSPCALAGQAATGIAITYPLANGKTQLVVAAHDGSRTFGTAAFGTR